MDTKTQVKLLEINQAFYDRYAPSFSATRQQVQPGVHIIMEKIPTDARVLDLGCGNGSLARALTTNGFTGHYLGLDMSEGLLESARSLTGKPPLGTYQFQAVNLASSNWSEEIHQLNNHWIVSFAVLHHLPSENLRLQTARSIQKLAAPGARVAVSVWQWQNSSRLRKRVLPWSTVGLKDADLDAGDVLLDWRATAEPGLRYIHTFDEESLSQLAEKAEFKVSQTFYSDGNKGNLALYQVWEPR